MQRVETLRPCSAIGGFGGDEFRIAAAIGRQQGVDGVARFKSRHIAPVALDHARNVASQDDGQLVLGQIAAISDLEVDRVDARGLHPHEDLVVRRFGHRQVF